MNDTYFMEMALDLARKGAGYTAPNPMVGAVVVKNGEVVGKGWHQKAGGPHAEVHAIDDAGSQAAGATIYVTLEPCNHTGKTPPCTEKILKAGIQRVVVAMRDPNPIAAGGMEYLAEQGVAITTGICEREAKKLNECFLKYVTTQRPFVILKCAATLDGRIATKSGDSKWISGEESRHFVHLIRHQTDAIMVGVDTVKADDPSLTTRLEHMEGKDPVRVILDTRLTIPENAKLLQLKSDSDTLLVCGDLSQLGKERLEKKKRLEEKGARIIEAPLKEGRIDLDRLMDILGSLGITSLLIEGGSRVIASALQAGIADKVFLFFAPKFLAGDDGIPICRGEGPALMKDCIPLKSMDVKKSGGDIMIEGYF